MKHITIKEAQQRYNKSLSTIRRTITKADASELKRGAKLNTGLHQVLVSIEYLDKCFNNSASHTENISNDVTSELIAVLKKQVEDKQNTIDKLLDRQKEIIASTGEAIKKLTENEERFQILLERSQQRANLLNKHFEKNRGTKPDLINEEDIIDATEEVVNDSSPFINTNDEKGFNDWMRSCNK